MAALSVTEIRSRLDELPGWVFNEGAIERTFTFESFVPAMAFVNRVADAAERVNHHPDITINYNRVKMALVTHSAGGITAKDFALAGTINGLESATPAN